MYCNNVWKSLGGVKTFSRSRRCFGLKIISIVHRKTQNNNSNNPKYKPTDVANIFPWKFF